MWRWFQDRSKKARLSGAAACDGSASDDDSFELHGDGDEEDDWSGSDDNSFEVDDDEDDDCRAATRSRVRVDRERCTSVLQADIISGGFDRPLELAFPLPP